MTIEELRAWAKSHATGDMKSSVAIAVLDLFRIADEANSAIGSACSIARRKGEATNWEAFANWIDRLAKDQHENKVGTCFQ